MDGNDLTRMRFEFLIVGIISGTILKNEDIKTVRSLVSFIILFVFWIFLSGKFDAFHLLLGVISAAIVTAWSQDLLIKDSQTGLFTRIVQACKLLAFIGWLAYQIVVANCHVIYVALHPNMTGLIEPQMVSFKTSLKKDLSRFIFATAITLTPGTVSIRVSNGEFLVYALTEEAATADFKEMESRVATILEA